MCDAMLRLSLPGPLSPQQPTVAGQRIHRSYARGPLVAHGGEEG